MILAVAASIGGSNALRTDCCSEGGFDSGDAPCSYYTDCGHVH